MSIIITFAAAITLLSTGVLLLICFCPAPRRGLSSTAAPTLRSHSSNTLRIQLPAGISPAAQNHQNNITLSSGSIASFALELACNTQTTRSCRRTARRDKSANKARTTIMKIFNRCLHPICILAVTCLLPAAATADTDYDRLVVFGDSLSDPGNAYVLTGMSLVPPLHGPDSGLSLAPESRATTA